MTVERVCGAGPLAGRGYCGRKTKVPATDWRRVTCADCGAALRADEAVRS